MRIHTYIVEHDVGFAPNPFWGACTLANCKPKIRKHADVGDVIVGTGSAKYGKSGCLVYWMKVGQIVTFDQYWEDSAYREKKPNLRGSCMQQYGDNIYYTDANGEVCQIDSFHSESNGFLSKDNLVRDTSSTNRVLIGGEYLYFGKSAPEIPSEFIDFVVKGQGHKNNFPDSEVRRFLAWLMSFPQRGVVNFPLDW
ncbi:hypothetical protein V6R97_13260 [Chromohalobacter salexigens]|uniref:Nmad2 family putative nucleotide modification protein n=1 Tax=Chromohalobacter israelensis TaxID=141390 RepID=UPI0032E8990C